LARATYSAARAHRFCTSSGAISSARDSSEIAPSEIALLRDQLGQHLSRTHVLRLAGDECAQDRERRRHLAGPAPSCHACCSASVERSGRGAASAALVGGGTGRS
jgi:hypothetical protein